MRHDDMPRIRLFNSISNILQIIINPCALCALYVFVCIKYHIAEVSLAACVTMKRMPFSNQIDDINLFAFWTTELLSVMLLAKHSRQNMSSKESVMSLLVCCPRFNFHDSEVLNCTLHMHELNTHLIWPNTSKYYFIGSEESNNKYTRTHSSVTSETAITATKTSTTTVLHNTSPTWRWWYRHFTLSLRVYLCP